MQNGAGYSNILFGDPVPPGGAIKTKGERTMKKLTALMLMLALLLGACALAEGELPYVREL